MLIKLPIFSTKKMQAGMTLLETLIALLILGVGLLGILTLQRTSTQFNQQALHYSQATFLAQDIVEKMRANNTALGQYLIKFQGSTSNLSAANSIDCKAQSCTPFQMAQWDLAVWKNQILLVLPESEIEILSLNDEYVVNIQYDSDRRNRIGLLSNTFETVNMVVTP